MLSTTRPGLLFPIGCDLPAFQEMFPEFVYLRARGLCSAQGVSYYSFSQFSVSVPPWKFPLSILQLLVDVHHCCLHSSNVCTQRSLPWPLLSCLTTLLNSVSSCPQSPTSLSLPQVCSHTIYCSIHSPVNCTNTDDTYFARLEGVTCLHTAWPSLAPNCHITLLPHTGDKDPYTQWAHGEYIVGTDNT